MLLLLLISSAFLLPWAGAGRIIGGKETKPNSRPYMAFLKIKVVNQTGIYTSRCGGFLIRQDAVLSAAHCAHKNGKVNITVTLGAHNISVQEPSQQRIPAERWVIHPDYSRKSHINDIVLLKLKTKARINKKVQPISIAGSNERMRVGSKCWVAGWGRTAVEGHGSDVLMEVELKVQNEKQCQKIFSKYLSQSMMCVGDENGKKATYCGDSGGPFVCNQKVHGIVSYGHEDNHFIKVFTRVSYFEPWIDEQLRKFALQELPGSPSSD